MKTIAKTPTERVHGILSSHSPAIIVGNGINKYTSPNKGDYGWDKLIESLWRGLSINAIPVGNDLSLTEAYDIINLSSEGESELIDRVIRFVESIRPTAYQGRLCQRMLERDLPVLTTNFDMLLEQGQTKRILKHPDLLKQGFTDYYPWNVYFGNTDLNNPIDGFGIWHINGTVMYPRSMQLGLTHYMNQVSRVRRFLHTGQITDDFEGKNQIMWKGFNTWLHIIFNCPLLILGLGLDVNETFLRWLLIERAKYFERFPSRRKAGWFLCQKDEISSGKVFFLQYLGIDTIMFDTFPELYESVLQ